MPGEREKPRVEGGQTHKPQPGGGPGAVGVNRVVRGGVETTLSGKYTIRVGPGDRLIIETPGGGGWGKGGPSRSRIEGR